MVKANLMQAALWMLGAALSFSAVAVAGRSILTEMNTFELMLYRSVIGLAVVSFALWRSPRGLAQVRTSHAGLHIRRNLFHYAGQNLWFFGLVSIPLAQLVALEFSSPLWVALLAPMFLAEPLTRARLLAALIGFAGVLVVAEPGASRLEWGHAAALLAAVGFAMNAIYTRQIMRTDSVLCVMFWMTLAQAAMSLALSLPGGIPWPSSLAAPWILVVGLAGLAAHYSFTSALARAPASVVAPMDFIRLPIIALVGMWLYGEPLRLAVFLGAALILGGNVLNLRSERRAAALA